MKVSTIYGVFPILAQTFEVNSHQITLFNGSEVAGIFPTHHVKQLVNDFEEVIYEEGID